LEGRSINTLHWTLNNHPPGRTIRNLWKSLSRCIMIRWVRRCYLSHVSDGRNHSIFMNDFQFLSRTSTTSTLGSSSSCLFPWDETPATFHPRHLPIHTVAAQTLRIESPIKCVSLSTNSLSDLTALIRSGVTGDRAEMASDGDM
jgi:hypothetical protein